MATLTIQDVSRRSGLSGPTLRYYEDVGLIGPIARDAGSGHRRYRDEDLDTLQALACLRAMGVGIEDMRTYQANRALGMPRRPSSAICWSGMRSASKPRSSPCGSTSSISARRRLCGTHAIAATPPRRLRRSSASTR